MFPTVSSASPSSEGSALHVTDVIAASQAMIVLKSNDGDVFSISLNAIESSEMLKQEQAAHPEEDVTEIPSASSACLIKVIEFLERYSQDRLTHPHPERQLPWYDDFVNVDEIGCDGLLQMILVANEMKIEPLLGLASRKVASSLKGKSPTEILRLLDVLQPNPSMMMKGAASRTVITPAPTRVFAAPGTPMFSADTPAMGTATPGTPLTSNVPPPTMDAHGLFNAGADTSIDASATAQASPAVMEDANANVNTSFAPPTKEPDAVTSETPPTVNVITTISQNVSSEMTTKPQPPPPPPTPQAPPPKHAPTPPQAPPLQFVQATPNAAEQVFEEQKNEVVAPPVPEHPPIQEQASEEHSNAFDENTDEMQTVDLHTTVPDESQSYLFKNTEDDDPTSIQSDYAEDHTETLVYDIPLDTDQPAPPPPPMFMPTAAAATALPASSSSPPTTAAVPPPMFQMGFQPPPASPAPPPPPVISQPTPPPPPPPPVGNQPASFFAQPQAPPPQPAAASMFNPTAFFSKPNSTDEAASFFG